MQDNKDSDIDGQSSRQRAKTAEMNTLLDGIRWARPLTLGTADELFST